jgi:hypothetical protein
MANEAKRDGDFDAIQRRFSKAIVSADGDRALADIRPGALSAERRLAVYRHNVITNLTNALADLYLVIHNIVDAPFFREAARVFITTIPSTSGNLNDFGAQFGQFLRGYAPAAELPYLPDVATLEWKWHCAFHAADGNDQSAQSEPLVTRLGGIAPDVLPSVRFVLHPSVALVQSAYPLFTIWQVNQPDYDGDWSVDWDHAESVVIYRDGFDVAIREIDAGAAAFLNAIASEKPLGEALESAFNANSEFDLQGFLLTAVQSNIIIDLWTPT